MQAVQRLAAQTIWDTQPRSLASDINSPNVEWLDVVDMAEEPPARHPWRAPQWQTPPGENPLNYAPNNECHGTTERSSLPHMGNLPTSWGANTRNRARYRAVVVSLMNNLPHFFGWHVGHKWGDFVQRNGTLTHNGAERLMAAWVTWRELPIPRNLWNLVELSGHPLIPPPPPQHQARTATQR